MNNNFRFDLSDYLIHFFRDIDPESPNAMPLPEHMGWHSPWEDTFFPATFMLRSAIRNGRLWATWSLRNGKRTIYGPDPAVCFTDMPVAAFIEVGRRRHAAGEAMSEVALLFPKGQMRKQGALPAIYGLSQDVRWPSGDDGMPRVLPASVLPLVEQYRHVSDISGANLSVDWKHEREWRWPCRGSTYADDGDYTVANWDDVPGLDFYDMGLHGMGAIVRTRAHAELVVQDMLAVVDAGAASDHAFGFVLIADELPPPEELRDRQALAQALQVAAIDLEPFFLVKQELVKKNDLEFSAAAAAIEKAAGAEEDGEDGGCWLWIQGATSEYVRSLIVAGRVVTTRDGRYLAKLPEFSKDRNLRQREAMTQQLAAHIKSTYGVACGYYSVKGTWNLGSDMHPFYSDVDPSSTAFYNANWAYK